MQLPALKSSYINHYKTLSYSLLFIGVCFRLYGLNIISGDYVAHLHPWMEHIKSCGLIKSMGESFANYTPPYLYLLSAGTLLPVYDLYYIKLLSIFFEIIAAIYFYKIICLYHDKNYALLSTAIFSCLPTLITNGAYWGQCDIIFTTFIIGSIYYLLKELHIWALLFVGAAFAFKLQTVFVLPFYALLILKGRIKWYYAPLILVPYLLAILPAYFAGRSITDLLYLYAAQDNELNYQLTLLAPSIYTFKTEANPHNFPEVVMRGMIIAGVITAIFMLAFLLINQSFTKEKYVGIIGFFGVLLPFVLPRMHERYFFTGELLLFLFALVSRRYYTVPLIIITISSVNYYYYFNFNGSVDERPLAIITGIAIVYQLYIMLKKQNSITG